MSFSVRKAIFLGLIALVAVAGVSRAQEASDNSPSQRVSVMTDKLDRMRRGLQSAISVLRTENQSDPKKKDDEKNVGTPLGRLVALQKDVSRVSSDVASLRGKLDKGEKYDRTELDSLEASVNELQTRVDSAQTDT
ncbi:MAG: hypothetical protein JO314_10010, partial [Acidobacteria bacterium]|nr:hypothetical protein [Acidobacteriota bacterium]